MHQSHLLSMPNDMYCMGPHHFPHLAVTIHMPELLDDGMLTGGVFITVVASLYSCMKMSIAALYCSPISLACRQLCNKTCQQFMSHVIAFIKLLRRKRISSITVVMSCLSFPSQLSFCHHFFTV